MPTAQQDTKDTVEKIVNRVREITLTFMHTDTEMSELFVKVDHKGILLSRKDGSVCLTKFEVLQIQRFLNDACSTVWRDDRAASRELSGLAREIEEH